MNFHRLSTIALVLPLVLSSCTSAAPAEPGADAEGADTSDATTPTPDTDNADTASEIDSAVANGDADATTDATTADATADSTADSSDPTTDTSASDAVGTDVSGSAPDASDAVGADVSDSTTDASDAFGNDASDSAVDASETIGISATATTTAQNLVVGAAMAGFSPLTPSGGTPPYTFSYTGVLPPGLSFSASTGVVTGTPSAVYPASNLVFSVEDANHVVASTTSTVSFTVVGATTAPSVPSGVTARAGIAQNVIGWTVVTGNTYNLYWSTTSGVGTAGTPMTGVTSPYVHNGRTNGTTYYYVVTAVAGGVESLASAQVSATPKVPGTARKVPDTGQTTSYTATFGEDDDYNAVNQPSYTDNSNSTVTDNVTGLMWQRCLVGQTTDAACSGAAATYNWYQATGTADATSNPGGATNVCGSQATGGFGDWRLPAPNELSFLHSSNSRAFFPTVFWANWSATPYVGSAASAWVADADANPGFALKTGLQSIRCVRGNPVTASFNDNGDGTVTDNVTALMWQQQDSTNWWEQDITYCEGLALATFTDWRLPNKNELQSIVDYSAYGPAIDRAYFSGSHGARYYSSTSSAINTAYAFYVDFTSGEGYSYYKTKPYYARCVRGGS